MAQKDLSEKSLQGFNEIFADIVNVLLFDGEEIVKQDELEDALPNSFYKIDGKLHGQERDVAKFWKNGEIRLSYMGLENQTAIDRYMPLRIMNYDSAVYRHQINELESEIKSAKKEKREIKSFSFYPVVTLVLYFGERHWSKHRELLDCLEVRPELKPFVNNYKINIVEMAYLPREKVDKFKSDFWFVADYFYQVHNNKDYNPPAEIAIHVNEVLNLLSIFTNNADLAPLKNTNQSPKEEHMFDEWYYKMKDRTTYEKAVKVAKAFIIENIPLETIAKCVELPLEEVVQLAESLKIPQTGETV